jgi:hypothetical protein
MHKYVCMHTAYIVCIALITCLRYHSLQPRGSRRMHTTIRRCVCRALSPLLRWHREREHHVASMRKVTVSLQGLEDEKERYTDPTSDTDALEKFAWGSNTHGQVSSVCLHVCPLSEFLVVCLYVFVLLPVWFDQIIKRLPQSGQAFDHRHSL